MTDESHPFSTVLGLSLAVLVPAFYTLLVPTLFPDGTNSINYTVVGLLMMWIVMFALLVLALRIEKRSLQQLGIVQPRIPQFVWGFLTGLVLMLLVPVLSVLSSQVLQTGNMEGLEETASSFPLLILAIGVLTAAVTEEVIFRGYLIQKLEGLTGSTWLAAVVSIIAFSLIHISGWDLAHALFVVLPLGIILTAVYLRTRSLLVIMMAHLIADLPLLFVA